MSSRDPFVEIGAGKPVFREGETGTEMYLIESGQVQLAGPGTNDVLGPGDFFGEDFLLDGKPRVCTATVTESARQWPGRGYRGKPRNRPGNDAPSA